MPILLCVLLLSILALPSCGPLSDYVGGHETAPSAPPPPADNNGAPTLYEPGAPAPPGAGEKAPLPGQSGTKMMPNGLPALPPKGIDLQKQFSEDIKDPVERIKRLENAVVELRRDFDAVYPSIQRLVAVEQDMQDLTRQLGTLLQNEPQSSAAVPGGAGGPERLPPPPGSSPAASAGAAAPAPVTAVSTTPVPPPAAMPPPVPAPAAVPAVKPLPPPAPEPAVVKPPAATGALQVQDVRIGEHPGSTRLVLDASGTTAYTADLDNGERLLLVDLPGAGWSAPAQGTAPKSPMVNSWSVQPLEAGRGTRLVVQLKKGAKITYQRAMPATASAPAKVIIDLTGE